MADLITPLRPVAQPVGAVYLILIEQISQALGQLITFAAILVIGEKPLQRLEDRLVHDRLQQSHQPPGQRRLVQW